MLLVGLTGGIASGKSTVAERFVHAGAELIDADQIAREVVLPGEPAHRKIVEHFGSEVLDDEGFIDRPRLGAVVFGDPDKRTLLNELTHPPVIARIAESMELLQAFDGIVVLDVPLLVEAGVDRGYDAVVVVATSPQVQIDRLVRLRGLAPDEARRRVESQAPLEAKLQVATHVIWNEGSLDELHTRTDEVIAELRQAAADKARAEAESLPDD